MKIKTTKKSAEKTVVAKKAAAKPVAKKAAKPAKKAVTFTVHAEKGKAVYLAGSFNEWSDTPMNPCSTGWENHDWYVTTTLDAGAEIKVKQADSWDFNKGGVFYDYSEGMYAYGEDNGPNLVIAESGTYLIIFNDITGFIRFIKQ